MHSDDCESLNSIAAAMQFLAPESSLTLNKFVKCLQRCTSLTLVKWIEVW